MSPSGPTGLRANIDATPLDVVLLSGVVGLAKKSKAPMSAAMEAFDRALTAKKIPAGRISDRVVRSAFASLSRSQIQTSLDLVPNPLPRPHNLSWYFGSCVCPAEVRAFATMIGRRHIRVWSVAHTVDGWTVLAQVFGGKNDAESVASVELETRVPAKRLQRHSISSVTSKKIEASAIESFLHDHAKDILSKNDTVGDFVEIFLERKA